MWIAILFMLLFLYLALIFYIEANALKRIVVRQCGIIDAQRQAILTMGDIIDKNEKLLDNASKAIKETITKHEKI